MKIKTRKVWSRLRATILIIGLVLAAIVGASAPAMATTSTITCGSYGSTPSFGCASFSGFNGQRPWGYPVDVNGHNCTNYVTYRLSQNGVSNPGNLGNAYQWDNNAQTYGIPVDTTPTIGSVAVWEINSPPALGNGHVAYVDAVYSDGSISTSEDNAGGTTMNRHLYPGSSWPNHFIHFTYNAPVSLATAPNVYNVVHQGTATGSTEVQILSASSSYQAYIGGWVTTDGTQSSSNVSYALADYNHDGILDLYKIIFAGTATGSTEVQILNGANNFSTFLGGWVTTDGTQNPANVAYGIGDFNHDGTPDLYKIIHQGTLSGHTEVQVLNGANNFTSYLGGWVTQDGFTTNQNVAYGVADYNHDNVPDVYKIVFAGTATGHTEVLIMNGAGSFQYFGGWVTTDITQTYGNLEYGVADYNLDNTPDLYKFNLQGTPSGNVEVQVLNGANNFTSYLGGWVTPVSAELYVNDAYLVH